MAPSESEARREASHWYVRLREEEGDEAAQAEFAEWLHADPAHAKAWQSMCETMEAVGRTPAEWRSCGLPGQVGRLRESRSANRAPRRRAGIAIGAAIAACALALALPTIGLHLRADHITAPGHVEQVRLADGSTVRLGPDSAIAVDYGDGGRTVRLLSGQAMFDVAHDEARPFRVRAGDVTATVLGTSFDVRMLGSVTGIAVAHGHVRVEDASARPTGAHDLHAGEWVRLDAGHAAETGTIAPQLVGGWQRGEALAENRTVGSMIDEIRPWFAGRIIVADAGLAGRRVTGIYNVRDPEQALAMIVRPHGGRVTRITPWLLVVTRK